MGRQPVSEGRFGEAVINGHFLKQVVPTNDGNFLAGGTTDSYLWQGRFDTGGILLWAKQYPGEGIYQPVTAMARAPGGGPIEMFTGNYVIPSRVLKSDAQGSIPFLEMTSSAALTPAAFGAVDIPMDSSDTSAVTSVPDLSVIETQVVVTSLTP